MMRSTLCLPSPLESDLPEFGARRQGSNRILIAKKPTYIALFGNNHTQHPRPASHGQSETIHACSIDQIECASTKGEIAGVKEKEGTVIASAILLPLAGSARG